MGTASSRLNWPPRRFKWTRPFRRKTNSGFCACAFKFRFSYTILTISDVSNWYFGWFGRPHYFQYNLQEQTRRAVTNVFLNKLLSPHRTAFPKNNVDTDKCYYHETTYEYRQITIDSTRHYTIRVNTKQSSKLEGSLTVHFPHEIIWNANLMQQGNFNGVFLARHVSGTYAHHQEH